MSKKQKVVSKTFISKEPVTELITTITDTGFQGVDLAHGTVVKIKFNADDIALDVTIKPEEFEDEKIKYQGVSEVTLKFYRDAGRQQLIDSLKFILKELEK